MSELAWEMESVVEFLPAGRNTGWSYVCRCNRWPWSWVARKLVIKYFNSERFGNLGYFKSRLKSFVIQMERCLISYFIWKIFNCPQRPGIALNTDGCVHMWLWKTLWFKRMEMKEISHMSLHRRAKRKNSHWSDKCYDPWSNRSFKSCTLMPDPIDVRLDWDLGNLDRSMYIYCILKWK